MPTANSFRNGTKEERHVFVCSDLTITLHRVHGANLVVNQWYLNELLRFLCKRFLVMRSVHAVAPHIPTHSSCYAILAKLTQNWKWNHKSQQTNWIEHDNVYVRCIGWRRCNGSGCWINLTLLHKWRIQLHILLFDSIAYSSWPMNTYRNRS